MYNALVHEYTDSPYRIQIPNLVFFVCSFLSATCCLFSSLFLPSPFVLGGLYCILGVVHRSKPFLYWFVYIVVVWRNVALFLLLEAVLSLCSIHMHEIKRWHFFLTGCLPWLTKGSRMTIWFFRFRASIKQFMTKNSLPPLPLCCFSFSTFVLR